MDKLYQATITIPETIGVEKKNNIIYFFGPLGRTSLSLKKFDATGIAGFDLDQKNHSLTVVTGSKSFFGLSKSIILNKFQGITRGFLVYLKLVGIGYRASKEGGHLFLKLGYSHDIVYKIPSDIQIFLVEPTILCVFGIDKNQVTQIAAKLRHLRCPSVYKGKGIRLASEKVLLKTGKRK